MAMFHPWSAKGGPIEKYDDGGTVGGGAIPSRYFQAGPAIQQGQVPIQQPGQPQQPPPPIPPQNGTPGGVITRRCLHLVVRCKTVMLTLN